MNTKLRVLLTVLMCLPATVQAATNAWTASKQAIENGGVLGAAALAIQPGTPTTAYASGYRVWKTTNGGASWQASDSGITNSTVEALAIDPTNPNVVYAGSYGVFKSTNGGASWAEVSNGFGYYMNFVTALAIDPVTPSTVYAGLNAGYGLWKTTDGGANWVKSDTGMVAAAIKAIAIDPKAHGTLYAATELNGLWKSTDGGANWVAAGLASEGVYALAIDPATSTLYAAGRPSLRATDGTYGVFKSVDGGAGWTAVNNGLPSANGKTNVDGRGLAIDASSGAIYLATYGTGAYRSTDGGASWAAFNDGMPVENPVYPTGARNLKAVAAANGVIYAGADNNLYSYGISGGRATISGSASGSNSSLSLLASVSVASGDAGQFGYVYVAAQLPSTLGGGWYFHNGVHWLAWGGGQLPIYSSGTLADTTIQVLSGLDVSGIVGTAIIVGYGTSESDMVSGQKYAVIYTIH